MINQTEYSKITPNSVDALMQRCRLFEGLTVGQLAARLSIHIPIDPLKCKGVVGLMLEKVLVTTAGNKALPDFADLGIELKTLPIGLMNQPLESTFITSIPLLTVHTQKWETSTCFKKLNRILWVPVEADHNIPFVHRRFGTAFLWTPTPSDQLILREDWTLLTSMITTGALSDIDARVGTYLQVRPKAANGKILCDAFDQDGNKIKTLPRGFYLRRLFTTQIWKSHLEV